MIENKQCVHCASFKNQVGSLHIYIIYHSLSLKYPPNRWKSRNLNISQSSGRYILFNANFILSKSCLLRDFHFSCNSSPFPANVERVRGKEGIPHKFHSSRVVDFEQTLFTLAFQLFRASAYNENSIWGNSVHTKRVKLKECLDTSSYNVSRFACMYIVYSSIST